MGVEMQHCALYGYRFDGRIPYDEISREQGHDACSRLLQFEDHDADEGDFVIYQEGRGGRYTVAGIVRFLTESTRWNGPQCIDLTVLDEPDPVLVEAMEQMIDAEMPDCVERKTDEPEHLVLTHTW